MTRAHLLIESGIIHCPLGFGLQPHATHLQILALFFQMTGWRTCCRLAQEAHIANIIKPAH
tara:strand:+ start:190 stop:372 length:183 start_codon:yes stop_codon:yes gene_type:complete